MAARRAAALLVVAGLALCPGLAGAAHPVAGHLDGPAEPITVAIIDTGIGAGALDEVADRGAHLSVVPGEDVIDHDGHGTEMAWIVHQAAPSARLVAIKAVDRFGSTTDDHLADAVGRARSMGASVVLLSLAGAEPLPRTYEAFAAAADQGVLIIAAAGNDGVDLDRSPSYPGGYRLPNLVTVAAVDEAGHLLGSSNRGGPVSLHAPGSVPTCSLDGHATRSLGTSGAAALVAGTAAGQREPHSSVGQQIAKLHATPINTSPVDCG